MFLEKLGVYGWSKIEPYCLASLLTGDPILLIGEPGTNKTGAAQALSEAMEWNMGCYNAAMTTFDDLLGFPIPESLNNKKMEICPTEMTVWDKSFVLVDEINRACPDLQSKWLDLVRSRKIMGAKTDVHWVWAAMNPYTTDEAAGDVIAPLLERFAYFIDVPSIHDMNEDDRIRVAELIGNDDAPALTFWGSIAESKNTIPYENKLAVGKQVRDILKASQSRFFQIKDKFQHNISEFSARFVSALREETQGKLNISGRSLGMIKRNLMAVWAIKCSLAEKMKIHPGTFSDAALETLLVSIPFGISEDSKMSKTEASSSIRDAFYLFEEYFQEEGQLSQMDKIYHLVVGDSLAEKIGILFDDDIDDLMKFKSFNKIIESGKYSSQRLSVMFHMVDLVANKHPHVVPVEVLEDLRQQIHPDEIFSSSQQLNNISIENAMAAKKIAKYIEGQSHLGNQLLAKAIFQEKIDAHNNFKEHDVDDWIKNEIEPEIDFLNDIREKYLG